MPVDLPQDDADEDESELLQAPCFRSKFWAKVLIIIIIIILIEIIVIIVIIMIITVIIIIIITRARSDLQSSLAFPDVAPCRGIRSGTWSFRSSGSCSDQYKHSLFVPVSFDASRLVGPIFMYYCQDRCFCVHCCTA